MHELNAGLNGENFATFLMLPNVFYHSFVLQMTFIRSTTVWTSQVDLCDFEKHMKRGESVKHNAELFL